MYLQELMAPIESKANQPVAMARREAAQGALAFGGCGLPQWRQFGAKDFKAFLCMCGAIHVYPSPFYPQSDGKIERWHGSLKRERISPGTPLCLEDTRRLARSFVEHYNYVRLHSSISYAEPKDKLEGRQKAVFAQRDRKLEEACERQRFNRQRTRSRGRDNRRASKPLVGAIGAGGYQLGRTRDSSISR